MVSGRPNVFRTALQREWPCDSSDLSVMAAGDSSQAWRLCQKQPHEASAVCHKHAQALRACQKRPILADANLLVHSPISCTMCRQRAYASACMCTAQFGTRHNAWAWQLASSARRPDLLNSSFLRVRWLLHKMLPDFLPHGKHVLACMCVDLRSLVAGHAAPTLYPQGSP